MREINKFGIANFKPFGDKMQKFDLKPITLIYGPNSIGKSSVIHSVVYFNNLYKEATFTPSEIKLGDPINLGGFENFVHKKNIENKVSLEFTYSGEVDSSLDKLRTGKYSYEERKTLLSITPDEMYNEIRKASIEINPWTWIDEAGSDKKTNIFFSWLQSSLSDYDYKTFDASRLELYVHETPELESNFFGEHMVLAYRYTERIYNKPLGTMEKFYERASDETKELLNIHQLYVQTLKVEKLTENGWVEEKRENDLFTDNQSLQDDDKLELTEDFFIDALTKASDDQLKSFTDDLYHYIQLKYNLDDIISVNTTIGKAASGEIRDLQTIYSIGDKWLFKSISSEDVDGLQKEENQRYIILLNDEHDFLEDILHNIASYGNWQNDDIKEQLKKYSNEEGILSFNSFICEKESVLLETEDIDKSILNNCFEWDYNFENYYTEYVRRSNNEMVRFMNNMKGKIADGEQETINISDEIFKRMGEKQNLNDIVDEYDVYGLNDILALIIFSWIVNVNKAISKTANIKYIGPLRSLPERYEFSYSNKLIDTNESSFTWDEIKNNKNLRDQVNTWLSSEKLKTPYKLQVQNHITLNQVNIDELKKLLKENSDISEADLTKFIDTTSEFSFIDKRYNTPVNIREMGLGVSQVIPILVSLYSDKNCTIAVEQPELHLHPAVQSDLADEFIKSYKNNSNTSLIETHSEHLLLRFMKRMRQTVEGTLPDKSLALTPNDVSILYVDADDNKTYVLELQLDEDGSLLDPWPGGFFEEGFAERFF